MVHRRRHRTRGRSSQWHFRWRPPRWDWAVAAIAVVGCFLGWQIVANTAADTRASLEPESALAWRSGQSEAHARLAAREITEAGQEASLDVVERNARAALRANPLERSSWRSLAIAADLRGEAERAAALMAIAGRRSLRDPVVEMWLLQRTIGAGHFEDALAHADALLRVHPRLRAQLAPTLLAFATDATARPALAGKLASDPPWRGWLLGELSKTAEPNAVFAVYQQLGEHGAPPTNDEIALMLNRFIADQRYQLAFLAWLHFLPAERQADLHYVYNGDFEWPISKLPFDWTVSPVRGATTRIAEEPAGNHILEVEFANTRVPYRHVSKLLVLPPGTYRLSGREKAESLRTERGMTWRIFCAENEKQTLASTPLLVGSVPWRGFDVSFDVPQTGCGAQWLRLELSVRAVLDQEVGGAVSYDALSVERAPVTN